MAPLFFKIFQKYTPGVSSVNSQHLSVVFAYGHTTLSTARSRPISEAKQGRAWLVLGWETAWEYQVRKLLLFLHWAANTLLQASAFIRSPLPLLIWLLLLLPFDFSVTSFCFRCDKKTAQPLRSSFLLQGGDRQAFFVTTWGDVPS